MMPQQIPKQCYHALYYESTKSKVWVSSVSRFIQEQLDTDKWMWTNSLTNEKEDENLTENPSEMKTKWIIVSW